MKDNHNAYNNEIIGKLFFFFSIRDGQDIDNCEDQKSVQSKMQTKN